MKFGPTSELTQKHQGQSTKITYIRPNAYINNFQFDTTVSCLARFAHSPITKF